jgi:N-acetylglucosaminyldiphosphoundecaprenol N-acetyl-beta-D-mannosaminyltransferase
VTYVGGRLGRGVGGWVVTPNMDVMRRLASNAGLLAEMATADLVVAEGASLVWASQLAGTPLPGRVVGSDLIESLSAALASDGRSVFVLGGEQAVDSGYGESARIAAALAATYPGLRIAGHASAPAADAAGADAARAAAGEDAALDEVCAEIIESKPDMVYVGLGFPHQERVIVRLRGHLPGAWFLGCGEALRSIGSDQSRATRWLRQARLAWLRRLTQDPAGLSRRYLRDEAPYAARLLGAAGRARLNRRRGR